MKKRFLLLAMPLILILGIVMLVEICKVRLLVVSGCMQRPVSEVSILSGIEYNQSMFFLPMKKISADIEANPYYEMLSIKREYPSTVWIYVRERQPCAVVRLTNGFLILDSEGFVLERKQTDSGFSLPVLSGLAVNTYHTGQEITLDRPTQLSAMQSVLQALEESRLLEKMREINLSSINDILLYTKDGLSVEVGNALALSDKFRYLTAVLEDLDKKGVHKGLVNLSSGKNATYREQIYLPGQRETELTISSKNRLSATPQVSSDPERSTPLPPTE